jgi:hypothetical protein
MSSARSRARKSRRSRRWRTGARRRSRSISCRTTCRCRIAFYQYALSPEDEARLAARRIAADGRTSGVILVPQSDWGRRVQTAFADEFAAAGGQIVDQADYLSSTADFNDISAAPPAHDRPARQPIRGPTRSSSSSPRSRCTGG